jgi:hypothetical protein
VPGVEVTVEEESHGRAGVGHDGGSDLTDEPAETVFLHTGDEAEQARLKAVNLAGGCAADTEERILTAAPDEHPRRHEAPPDGCPCDVDEAGAGQQRAVEVEDDQRLLRGPDQRDGHALRMTA